MSTRAIDDWLIPSDSRLSTEMQKVRNQEHIRIEEPIPTKSFIKPKSPSYANHVNTNPSQMGNRGGVAWSGFEH